MVVIAVGSVLAACGPTVPDAGDTADTAAESSTTGTPSDPTSGVAVSTGMGTTSDPSDPTMATSATTTGDDATGGSTTWFDDTNDTACGFYGGCPVDGGDVSYECDVFMNDCGKGEKCAPWANDGGSTWNASRCVPLDANPVPVGEPCEVEGSGVSGIDTCENGAFCFHVDPDSNEGVCVEVCGGSEDDPTCVEGTCIVQFDGVLPLCFVTCDPKDPSCTKAEVCEPVLDDTLEDHVCNRGPA
jgi:hypothetical protein